MEERRTQPRVPFAGKAYLTYNGRCRCEDVLDVSRDGLQIATDARLKPGKEVKVFLPLPGQRGWRLCLLKGEVARREKGRRGEARLGITLRADEVDTRELLAAYCHAS
jgi:hypothetical protein